MPDGFLPENLLFDSIEEALIGFKTNFKTLSKFFIKQNLSKFVKYNIFKEDIKREELL